MGNQGGAKPKNGNGNGKGGVGGNNGKANPTSNQKQGGGGNGNNNQQNQLNHASNPTESKKKPFKRFFFVKPWPTGKAYLSKNGNKLSKECDAWFSGHCYKCGHNSHDYTKCRTYTDSTAYLSLCSRCNQGFHEQCRRRYVKENTVADQLKQIQIMYDHLAMHPPRQPFMLPANANQGAKVEEPSDED